MLAKDYSIIDLLTITEDCTIFDILGKMEIFEEIAQEDARLNRILPFHHTYYLITKSVTLRTYAKKDFLNEKALQKLDVNFAQKYFDALIAYIIHTKYKTPWKEFFKFIDAPNYQPFASLLMGINSHINGDLALSLIESNYLKLPEDFRLINEILRAEVSEVLEFVSSSRFNFFSFAATIFQGLAEVEFEKVIIKWREQALVNAFLIKKDKKKIKELHLLTESLSREIGELINIKNGVLLPKFINNINSIDCILGS